MTARIEDHQKFMKMALRQAQKALDLGEVPIGAIVVHEGKVIARGCNQVEMLKDTTAHAEMIALTAAFHQVGSKYLRGCTLYVTLEPCVMCAGAIKWAQISTLVYGASDRKGGFQSFLKASEWFAPDFGIVPGIMETESRTLLLDFFGSIR